MIEIRVEVGECELVLQTNKLAKQANGAIFASYEGVTVLATACCSSKVNEELDFVPLQVEYNEKYYAAGKIPGGFIKREGRPKDKEILVSRLIDRPLRPLFSKDFKREIQVIPTTISTNQVNPADVIAICAASASVVVSDVPFDGPVAGVRVIHSKELGYQVNPGFEQIKQADLEIIVAGTSEGITMVEGGAAEVSEETLLEAIEFAHPFIKKICSAQLELAALVGKEKLPLAVPEPFALEEEITNFTQEEMTKACFVKGKMNRNAALNSAITRAKEHFADRLEEGDEKRLEQIMDVLEQKIVRESILKKKLRSDNRAPEEIRGISCEIAILPRTHGSALFTRGETQALAIATLGTVTDEQVFDDIDGDRRENFLLHYNFPPYSVGEVGRLGTGRREIGHGHLAYRSLLAKMPGKEVFPYTIRVVSEILESNGSSSMATVCASSLALMQAGVPIESAIAGIAMGLVKEGDDFVVLSDILGEEDHLGDMDFKVAGTEKGITGFQMDIKIQNINSEIIRKALSQAKEGRLRILQAMNDTIKEASKDLSEHAPRIVSFNVNPDQIGLLIGSGGKTIKGINEKYQVQTDIDDAGIVTIYSKNAIDAENAKTSFEKLLEEPEVGKEYDGVVRRIMDFGAFIEILPGKEGLCHISRMSQGKIDSVHDVLHINQEIRVKIIEIDRLGRVNLALLYEGNDEPRAREHRGDSRYDARGGQQRQHRSKGNYRKKTDNNYNRKPRNTT